LLIWKRDSQRRKQRQEKEKQQSLVRLKEDLKQHGGRTVVKSEKVQGDSDDDEKLEEKESTTLMDLLK